MPKPTRFLWSRILLRETSEVWKMCSSWVSCFSCAGSAMLIAWMVCASFSVLIPRYCKHAWPDTTWCGKKIWFQVYSFYCATHYSAKCGLAIAYRCLSVCLSVCDLSVCDVGGSWPHRLKILETVARTISLISSLFVAQRSSTYSQRNMEKFFREIFRRKCSFNTYVHNVRLNWVNRESRDLRWGCGCLLFVYFCRRIAR